MRTTDRSSGVLVHERDLENICLLSSMCKPRTVPRSASAERHQGKTGLEWIHAKQLLPDSSWLAAGCSSAQGGSVAWTCHKRAAENANTRHGQRARLEPLNINT
jgi:hypothetical protein